MKKSELINDLHFKNYTQKRKSLDHHKWFLFCYVCSLCIVFVQASELPTGSDSFYKEPQSSLITALEADDFDAVKNLLLADSSLDINFSSASLRTPVHKAAENGLNERLQFLIQVGADVNCQDTVGQTPLHLAVQNGHIKSVKILLSAGARIDVHDHREQIPFHLAAQNGHAEVIEALTENGNNSFYNKFLLNKLDTEHRTPLHLAAQNGHAMAVQVLCNAGVDLNILDRKQQAPLHKAVDKSHIEVVKILLQAGANPYLDFAVDSVALLDKILKKSDVKLKQVFIQFGSARLLKGAVRSHDVDLIKKLISEGVDVNAQDKTKHTPLFWGTLTARNEIIQVLIEAGAVLTDSEKTIGGLMTMIHSCRDSFS